MTRATVTGFQKLSLKRSSVTVRNERVEPRYPIETEVVITCREFKGRYKTRNISSRGFATLHNLPPELSGKSIEFVIRYKTSSGQIVQTEGKAQVAANSLNRFIIASGTIENFFAQVWV